MIRSCPDVNACGKYDLVIVIKNLYTIFFFVNTQKHVLFFKKKFKAL